MSAPQVTVHPPNPSRQPPSSNLLPPLIRTPSGLALLELQGSFKLSECLTFQNDSGQVLLGKIDFPDYKPGTEEDTTWMKRVYLYVDRGMRLTGEVKKLPKAIAIVRKKEDREGLGG